MGAGMTDVPAVVSRLSPLRIVVAARQRRFTPLAREKVSPYLENRRKPVGDNSAIQWTESTWNPITGCSKVSPGCAYCYAERLSLRFKRSVLPWLPANAEQNVVLHPERLDQPLRWKRPRMIFVNSMSDLFHENAPEDFIYEIFRIMAHANWHTFQILTKRPERMAEWCDLASQDGIVCDDHFHPWPLKNVWLGVSVENQRMANQRIPLLIETAASVRFLSCEPLLGPIDLRHSGAKVDWVIVGGESGGPERRRLVSNVEMTSLHSPGDFLFPKREALKWVHSLRDQCISSGVPFFFKQWGGATAKSGGRMLDGRTWDEYPGAHQ